MKPPLSKTTSLMPFSIALLATTVPIYAAASTVSVFSNSALISFSRVEADTKVCPTDRFLRKPCEKEQSLSRCATAPFTQGSRRQQTAIGYGRDAEGNKLRTVIQRSRTYQAATSYVRTPISGKSGVFRKTKPPAKPTFQRLCGRS